MGGTSVKLFRFVTIYTYMHTADYEDKYKMVIKHLLVLSKWADNPIKYDGRAQGQSFMHMSREQNDNILLHLQDKDKVIEIVNKPKSLPNDSPLHDNNYYLINVKSGFDKFANKQLSNLKVDDPLISTPIYDARKGILFVRGEELQFDSKTLQGRILKNILRRPGVAVNKQRIDDDYTDFDKSVDLTSEAEFKKSVNAINSKIKRKLHTGTNFVLESSDKLKVNPKFITQEYM